MGDPKGMHTFDCPVYQANVEAWEALQRRGSAPVMPKLVDPFAAAERRGFDRAVALLRDDERYLRWWSSSGCIPDGPVRQHLADYLQTVRDLEIGASRG
jgi:hypothetical protein